MRAARCLHALTALIAGTALVVELVLIVTHHRDLGRFLSYFTVQSNLLVCIVAAMLVVRPDRDGPVWRVFRLDAIVAIVITGLVYHLMLASLRGFHGIERVVDTCLHAVVPLLAVIGWFLFGPRPRITPAVIGYSMVLPTLWFCYTLVRGAIVHWYPYPFLNVTDIGYGAVIVNAVSIGVGFVALGFVAMLIERRQRPWPRGGGEVTDGS
jgi:hypothetical protein